MPRGRRALRDVNIWPGFVDALTSLVLAFIFVLLVFVVAQFTLSEVLTGRDAALKRLNRQVSELADMLSLERKANTDLKSSLAQLSAELQSSNLKRDTLASRLSELSGERDKLTEQLEAAQQSVAAGKSSLAAQEQLTSEAQKQVALLNEQLAALRDQLASIQQALDASEAANKKKDVQIVDLGKRLNVALAGKVEELARYRSQFFGQLRAILGARPDIRIVGDRFVFQSEVLFPSSSAELSPAGLQTIGSLASTLKQIEPKIPKDINWILEVDGFTDKRPISTVRFPSNWELSSARAIAVVKALVADGVPADHLSAAGFGEYQPIDPADTPAAYAKNRRIELKLTQH
ncbi:MAG TPA: peptidoglycan -binding protein [Alphaproteobacteria bacterium]|nr:peptidoglycan -binding protein [Alphaproteobacteria bacterium]